MYQRLLYCLPRPSIAPLAPHVLCGAPVDAACSSLVDSHHHTFFAALLLMPLVRHLSTGPGTAGEACRASSARDPRQSLRGIPVGSRGAEARRGLFPSRPVPCASRPQHDKTRVSAWLSFCCAWLMDGRGRQRGRGWSLWTSAWQCTCDGCAQTRASTRRELKLLPQAQDAVLRLVLRPVLGADQLRAAPATSSSPPPQARRSGALQMLDRFTIRGRQGSVRRRWALWSAKTEAAKQACFDKTLALGTMERVVARAMRRKAQFAWMAWRRMVISARRDDESKR